MLESYQHKVQLTLFYGITAVITKHKQWDGKEEEKGRDGGSMPGKKEGEEA